MKRSIQNTRTLAQAALRGGALLAGLVLVPARVQACAACYGQSDSPLAQGMNWGIFSLMGVIGLVLGAIVLSFIQMARRAASLQRQSTAEAQPADARPDSGPAGALVPAAGTDSL